MSSNGLSGNSAAQKTIVTMKASSENKRVVRNSSLASEAEARLTKSSDSREQQDMQELQHAGPSFEGVRLPVGNRIHERLGARCEEVGAEAYVGEVGEVREEAIEA